MAIYDPKDKREIAPEEDGFFPGVKKAFASIKDVEASFLHGFASGIEGTKDIALLAAGAVSMNEDFKKKMQELVEPDNSGDIYNVIRWGFPTTWIGEGINAAGKHFGAWDENDVAKIYANDKEAAERNSALTGTEAGDFVKGIAESAGGMAFDYLLGAGIGSAAGAVAGQVGASASKATQVAQRAREIAGLSSLGVRATGNAAQEALNEGAEYNKALLYGLSRGATEVATEKLVGGGFEKVYGGGFFPNVTKSVAGRAVGNIVGEGLEEVASELADPLEKSIYKGKEALGEYKTGEYWKNVGLSGLSGAAMAGIAGTAQGMYTRKATAANLIQEATTEITNRNNQDANGKLTPAKEAKLNESISGKLKAAEKYLSGMKPDSRAKFIEDNNLGKMFDNSGKIRPEFARRTWGGQSADGTANAGLSLNVRYDTERVDNVINDSNQSFANSKDKEISGMTISVHEGELTSEQSAALQTMKRMVNNLNNATGNDVGIVVVDSSKEGVFNAFHEKKSDIIVVDASALGSKTMDTVHKVAEIAVEEIRHSSQIRDKQGRMTKAGFDLLANLMDTKQYEQIVNELTFPGNRYGFTREMYENLLYKGYLHWNELTEEEKALADEIDAKTAARVLSGDKSFIYKYAEDHTVAGNMINALEKVEKWLSRATSKEARAEYKRVKSVKETFLEALAEKGYTYKNGKIISARPPEEKEEGNERFNRSAPIDLSDDTELSQRIGNKKGSAKYKVIQQYVLESLPEEVTLSDGIKATLDNRDALHIAVLHSADKGVAEVSKIREIVETAKPYAYEDDVDHDKFSYFRYYQAFVKYGDDTFPVYVNVGLTRNKTGYKIYDLTEKIRDTAHLLKGVERLPDGSIALGNGILDNSVPQTSENVKPKSEKISSISQIEQKYKDETKYLLLNEGKDTIKISNMVVKEEYRGKGIGQQILSDVISYADSVGKTITLTPTQEFGTYERLKNWYKKNGFVENKGRNADLRISDTMYRAPVTAADQQNIRFSLPANAENLAKEHFGTTTKWRETGYLTTDGTMLDFSGRHWGGDGGGRDVDHMDIADAFEGAEGYETNGGYREEQFAFVNRGNIRIVPETPGINLVVEPTDAQYAKLRNFFALNRNQEIVVDYDNESGKTIDSQTFKAGTPASQINESIRNHFEEGSRSDLMRFHTEDDNIRFSRAPQTDTPEFKRWFGDSKVVNEDGTPKVVYHGTSNEFWSFDINKSNDKLGRMMGLGSGKDKIYLTEYKASAQAAAISSKSRGRGGIERVLPLYVSANKVLDKSDYRRMLESAYEKYPNSDPRKSGYDYTQRDKAIAEVDRNIKKQGYDCVWDKESGELFVFSPTQVKSATDNIGTFDPSNPDIRFSRGLNARVAANNTGESVFSKKVAKAAIETIMESNLVFGDEYSTLRGTIRGKGRIIDELFYKLNRTQNRDYQRAVANSIADQIIDSTVLTETYSAIAEQDAANIEQAKRIAEMMSGYRHGIKFKNIEGDVKYAKDDRWAGYKLQWAAKEGDTAISADQLVDAFDEIGVKIEAVNDADIFLEAMRLYENARETINNAVYKVKLSEYGSQEELARLKKTISDEIMSVFENGGERSKFSKMVSKYTDQIKFMREMWKVSKKVSEIKMEGKRFASDTRSQQLNAATSLLKGMTRGSNLIPGRAREVCRNLATWYSPENNLFKAAEGETDERGEGIKTNRFFNPQIREMMETIGNGEGGLTAAEMNDLSHIMDFMANFVKTYKRVFQNGRYVDADTIAEADIALARKAKHGYARNAVVRFVQKTAESYGLFAFDPASIARMADGYRNGFFTHLHEEMREAALQMAAVRYELQTAQSEFYKEHKGYAPEKRMVKVRGVEMPADFAISLYMTAKRKQSWLGLVQSGYRLFLEDGEVSAKALGAKDEVYTDEQLADIVKGFRSEIDLVLTDTDRAYIATVEGVLKRAGELKMERDIQRMGFTNATEDYYYPILRAHMAKNFDANLTLGKSGYFDTVTNLSMNKDTVKNNAELGIQSVNQVISRHIDQTAMYYGLSNMVDNFNMLSNLNLSDNPGKPETMLRTANESIFGKKAMQYFQKMLKDLEGVYYADPSEKRGIRLIDKLRSNAAVAAIAANPKVIATQFSSLFAGTAILSPRDIAKGITLTKVGKYSDVDKYSEVARLRNANLEAARAETITDKVGKVGEFAMRPVAATDRLVVQIEFGACQAYVERTQGLAIGTEENLVAAGKLLNRVINETQQGANLTERSAMARSSNPIYKGLAMFRNDAVKQIGRVIDGFGELAAIKEDLRTETDAAKIEELKGRQKTVRRKTAKAVGALVGASMYQALIGLLFAAFLNRLKDKDDDEIVRDVVVDSVAGMFTGLPIISQTIEFYTDGYGVEDFTISSFNDLLQSTQDMGKVIGGNATEGEVKSAIRGAIYSGGKLLGIPTRNAFNYFYGTVNTINEYAGYKVHGLLYSDNYKSELYKALDSGDTDRAQMLGSLLVDSSFGGYSKATKDAIKPLVATGYTVLPRTVGNSITYDGQEYKLTSRQKARFQKVYGQASAAVQKVVSLQSYKNLSDDVKAQTIKRIYDMYYNLAVDDLLGTDTEDKTVLFSYAIDPDKLALIVSQARSIQADTDKNGNVIDGSKKQKVVAYVNGLKLTAAQKYMVMGYLGYRNAKGEDQVKAYINRLRQLSKAEKEMLLEYSGYAA